MSRRLRCCGILTKAGIPDVTRDVSDECTQAGAGPDGSVAV